MTDGSLPWVDVRHLADHGPVGALDVDGSVRAPVLLVRLDAPAESAAVAAAAAAVADAVADVAGIIVGVATGGPVDPAMDCLVGALDLTLVPPGAGEPRERVEVEDPVAAAAQLHAAVAANPQAATVLAGLLRWSGSLRVPDALDAESLAYSTLLGGREFRRWLERRGPRASPPPAADPVLVARDGDELRITLNRPERRNAYGREVRDGLVAALEIAVFDPGVARVVLDGAGPLFSAGGDLAEFGTAPDLATAHLVRTRGGAGRLLHRLAQRVEARVHGRCVGAGIELPAFAGRVVARGDATFQLPEVGMGLIPGAGGTVSIPRRIGRWRALYLALSGRPLDAVMALEWGLVDVVEAVGGESTVRR
ncbi:enoyl-CoA hydratase/isomerase family protein [Pseudonocardia aurantiaca]|uniref:Enoyl-CoA hydratase/isomerase family protein n=1 Tax=Pseudonocardia aurantiaca TaxID=75290 RepID=A0ABW4FNY4_9PSEU